MIRADDIRAITTWLFFVTDPVKNSCAEEYAMCPYFFQEESMLKPFFAAQQNEEDGI